MQIYNIFVIKKIFNSSADEIFYSDGCSESSVGGMFNGRGFGVGKMSLLIFYDFFEKNINFAEKKYRKRWKKRIHSASLMPCIVLGILPAVAALFVGKFTLLLFGILFISAAVGDIWVSRLLMEEKSDCMVLDNPTEIVFDIISKNSLYLRY